MLRNYLVVAWRNLLKNKAYSVINISGLAIGLACALAIALFIADEYSYDRFHEKADRIYRVVQEQNQAGDLYQVASTSAMLGPALEADFPEVVNSCRLGYKRSGLFQVEGVTVQTENVIQADAGLLDVFDFQLLRGNPKDVFTDPKQLVITDRLASSLFGSDWQSKDNLIGTTIIFKKTEPLVLAGIIHEAPTNSHLQFDAILTYDPSGDGNDNWFSNNYLTYIELADGADAASLDEKLHTYITKHTNASRPFAPVFYLQPLGDIYLYSDFAFQTDWTKTGSVVYVRVFLAVGLVVLTIAIFNFINLSTARAMRRAKEVGIRKTIGAYHNQLMAQFLSESLLITAFSVSIALGFVEIALPFLNDVASKALFLPLTDPAFLVQVAFFTLVVSCLAGIYPAIYLSSFRPASVLRGLLGLGSGQRFRQVLVVTQFALTVILVAASIVIYQQLTFMQEKDLGFQKDNLIYLDTEDFEKGKAVLLRDELRRHSAISHASLASNSLIDVINSTLDLTWEGQVPGDNFLITRVNTDPAYLGTTGMRLLAGRNFNDDYRTDSTSFIINETAARRMGWTTEQALGKALSLWNVSGHIIGVVADFHYRPMTTAIEPLAFVYRPYSYYSGIMIRATNAAAAIDIIEATYRKYEPAGNVDYNFVDDQLDRQYALQKTTGKLVLLFSVLAILVACLGLYGLAAFTTERRTKEIGIRKVLGATVTNVSVLLSRDFVSLVLVGIVIASPFSYMLMRVWLAGFVYRIELNWIFFVAAGLLALTIAGFTVLYQAVVAANMNPVKSLRAE